MWLVGVVVRRYIDFLILLIHTPLVFVLFAAAASLLFSFKNVFSIYYKHCSLNSIRPDQLRF